MRATANVQHNELLGALEALERAVTVLAIVTLMAQDRSREAAIKQIREMTTMLDRLAARN